MYYSEIEMENFMFHAITMISNLCVIFKWNCTSTNNKLQRQNINVIIWLDKIKGGMNMELEQCFVELINNVYGKENFAVIEKAFRFAEKKHKGL